MTTLQMKILKFAVIQNRQQKIQCRQRKPVKKEWGLAAKSAWRTTCYSLGCKPVEESKRVASRFQRRKKGLASPVQPNITLFRSNAEFVNVKYLYLCRY